MDTVDGFLVSSGCREGDVEGLLEGLGLLFWGVKLLQNYTVMMISQICEYTKTHLKLKTLKLNGELYVIGIISQ